MYPTEINTQIASAHIAELHAQAAESRLAARVRPRRGLRSWLHAEPKRPVVTARAVCSEAH